MRTQDEGSDLSDNRGQRRTGAWQRVTTGYEDPAEIAQQLAELRMEHRALDEAIRRLAEGPGINDLQLRRLKKRKLALKDLMARLESRLIPDLDA